MLVSLGHVPQGPPAHGDCNVCGSTEARHLMIYCVTCRKLSCTDCTRGVYASRDRLGVCKRCPLPHSMMAAVVVNPCIVCGRCQTPYSKLTNATSFFCESCAAPVCYSCWPQSFECGHLYCRQCADSLVRWDYRGIRQLVDESLLGELYSGFATPSVSSLAPQRVAAPVNTKYRQLNGKTFIGKGAQATVYKCETADGELVVSKEMAFTDREEFEAQRIQAESMQPLCHTHLIRYLDVISDPTKLTISIILPYYSKGDLKQLIFHHQGPVPVFKLCSLVLQLTTALAYLHGQKPPLVHGDVKPENVLLLNNEEQVLLMDLDLCGEEDKPVPSTVSRRVERAYTCEYSAPEVRQNRRRTVKSDIFSLGVVTYALAALPSEIFLMHKGNVLLLSDEAWEKDFAVLDRLIRTAVRQRCASYPATLTDLIMDMLRYRPEDRPTASDVERRLSAIMTRLMIN